jgi:hypothetical protein
MRIFGCSQRDFTMLAYSLNQQINGEKLLQDIQNMIQKEARPNVSLMLVIKLQEITSESTSHILKIEHKPT